MTRKDILEMKQQVIVGKDSEHLMSTEEMENVDKTHALIKDGYEKLTEEDRQWVDEHMAKWYENYMLLSGMSCGSKSAKQQTSCASCGSSEACGAF